MTHMEVASAAVVVTVALTLLSGAAPSIPGALAEVAVPGSYGHTDLAPNPALDTNGGTCNCDDEPSSPVCGSDGESYPSSCAAECAGVKPLTPGFCSRGCHCPVENPRGPVCGYDNVTYASDCLHACTDPLMGFRSGWQYTGKCRADCRCPQVTDTVCDPATGNEADSPCSAECSGFTNWVPGTCEPCVPNCPGDYDPDVPFCGFDGVTYDNGCLWHCTDSNPLAYLGPCDTDCSNCDAQGGPEVCGGDGKTYPNACAARCTPVGVVHDGPCRATCDCAAHALDPVCAANGNTYLNRCFAECVPAHVIFDGPCVEVPFLYGDYEEEDNGEVAA